MQIPKVSGCCGANEQSEGYYSVEGGRCPECKEHCEFVDASIYFEDGSLGIIDAQGIIQTPPTRPDYDPVNSLISTMALGWVITLICGVAIGYYIGAAEASAMVLEAMK